MKNNKKKKKNVEVQSTLIAISALIISAISLWFSYYSYKESQTEKLNIIADSVYDEYQTKIFVTGERVVIPIYWDIYLINNSEKTLSITDYEVENKKQDAIRFISFFERGLFSNMEDYNKNKIELPIIINSGESKRIYMRFAVLCGEKASKVLIGDNSVDSDLFKNGEWVRTEDIKYKLAENGLDFYDNKVTATLNEGKILTMSTEIKKQHEFKIRFTTGKGSIFVKHITLYMAKS